MRRAAFGKVTEEGLPVGRFGVKKRQISSSMRPFSLLAALLLLAFAAGCATNDVSKENLLTRAGFRVFVATKPKQVALYKTLPPGKITAVESHGRTYFVFVDPKSGNRIYAGTKKEYAEYVRLRTWKKLEVDAALGGDISPSGSKWDDWDGLNDGWYSF